MYGIIGFETFLNMNYEYNNLEIRQLIFIIIATFSLCAVVIYTLMQLVVQCDTGLCKLNWIIFWIIIGILLIVGITLIWLSCAMYYKEILPLRQKLYAEYLEYIKNLGI